MNSTFVVKDFKQLKVWQKSIEFTRDIYKIAGRFPKFEEYALKSQLVRAATSISANIAEGNAFSCLYPQKELSFISIAIGSANEVRSWLVITLDNKYITQAEFEVLDEKLIEIIKMLHGYIRKIQMTLTKV